MKHAAILFSPILAAFLLGGCARDEGPDHDDDHQAEEAGEIAHTQPMPGITTAQAAPRELHVIVSTYGTLMPNAERTRNVSARYPGLVTQVLKSTGDRVAAGETLASIESNESLQVYALKAPIAGTITARNVNAGESVESQTLFTVSDLTTLWAELMIFPRDVGKIRVDQSVRLTSSDGSLITRSAISHVSPLGSAGTQAVTVRVPMVNSDGRWRPGLNVAADIEVSTVQVPVAVHAAALQTVDGVRVVFVPHEGGFAPRPVQTGRGDDEFVEVMTGLAAGESYAAQDSFLIKAELEKAGAAHEH
jgi:cobalt-zinc-cadmium efflux system membrane fusion protein